MAQPLIGFLAFAIGIVAVAVAPVVAVWLIMQILKGLGFVIGGAFSAVAMIVRHVGRFVKGVIVDSLQFAGSLLTAGVVIPLAAANLALVRLRAFRHYAGAAEDELMNALSCIYRVGLGHPVRFLGLGALTDGLERRLPKLLEEEPRTTASAEGRSRRLFSRRSVPSRASSRGDALRRGAQPAFDGYRVESELKAGGSGARLFAATPTGDRVADLKDRGLHVPAKVVIKAFALGYGSTIPQIVRESRSLEAAKRLGLILDHAIDEDAFHYVMPFVPGDDLDTTTRELHARSTTDGLQPDQIRTVLGYARDLCDHLTRFHSEGLWHKDIKPSNLMVTGSRLQVVDFGLVTPLESALTLTTHGTEFFRDPELVRLALAGKRVKDVDGVKFDLYSAGAVLYSMVENSFPAHGSLSSITKPVPGALRWIVRRAMADIDKRYASAEELGRDLDVLLGAADPNKVRPADLPSVHGRAAAPRAQRAAYGPETPFEAQEQGEEESDVRRFEAFGVAAEVRGLDRMRKSMRTARAGHRARKESARAEREQRRTAKQEAKADAKLRRRRRGRGVLKAGAILCIFMLIGGGLRASHSSTHARTVTRITPASAGTGYDGGSMFVTAPVRLHSSLERDLDSLRTGGRVLVVADPGSASLSREAERVAAQLRGMGLTPVGFAGDQDATLDMENIALLGDAFRALEGRPSGESERHCLSDFLAETGSLDGILYLSAGSAGRPLRAILETAPHPLDNCEGMSPTGGVGRSAAPNHCFESEDCSSCETSCSTERISQ